MFWPASRSAEGDGEQCTHDQITVPRPSEGDRRAKNRKRKGALNISGGTRHGAEGNGAQRDCGYVYDESQGDSLSNPSHARH
jgi:hypothetical protein